ncbi:helix-turn-helix domain-containing protein [Isoptericola jiangsuensis]|uniref:helix-turn-helix domain-containing protein n=1 Tax=Isoptericola jiangsuensis TaxID=548579 RepID=UPI003AAD3C6A
MRELIGRLTVTDADAASALRVIAHFDNLVEGAAPREAILRAAAALAGVAAGFRDSASGITMRVDPAGNTVGGPPAASPGTSVVVDRSRATSVWLERDGSTGPLDELILERCAQALRVRIRPVTGPLTPEELAYTACDPTAPAAERGAALTVLGLPADPVVMATPPDVPPEVAARAHVAGGWIGLLPDDEAVTPERRAPTVRTGLARSHGGDVPGACDRAVAALNLAVAPAHGGPTVVRFEELGAARLISERLTPQAAAADPEIVMLETLRARRPWVPETFYHLASGATLRQAAQALQIHHSTLQDRLEWLEAQAGFALRTPEGRLRAANAWTLWRISRLLQTD